MAVKGRSYTTTSDADNLDPKTCLPNCAGLILMRWPRPAAETKTSDATTLLSRCPQHLAASGAIIVISASRPGSDENSYLMRDRTLLSAAKGAGLRHLHDIVAVDSDQGRDTFTYSTDQCVAATADTDGRRVTAAKRMTVLVQPCG